MPGAGPQYNGPTIPVVYDPRWQVFQNLTPAQVLAFQSFPQDLIIYTSNRRWLAEVQSPAVTVGGIPVNADDRSKTLLVGMRQAIDDGLITQVPFKDASGTFHTLSAADAKTAHQAVISFIQQLYAVEGQLLAGIAGGTITTRNQIDLAIAAVAPNSPSATQPSPT